MLVCLEFEIAFIDLKLTPFLLEQAVALFESPDHVTLAPLWSGPNGIYSLSVDL